MVAAKASPWTSTASASAHQLRRVRAGDTVVLKRGDGMRDLCETFSEEGILLTIPVPARRELLSALRGRAVPLAIDFQGTSGGYRRGPGGREVYLAMTPALPASVWRRRPKMPIAC